MVPYAHVQIDKYQTVCGNERMSTTQTYVHLINRCRCSTIRCIGWPKPIMSLQLVQFSNTWDYFFFFTWYEKCYPLPYILYSPKTNPYYPCPHMYGYLYKRSSFYAIWPSIHTQTDFKVMELLENSSVKIFRKLLYTFWVWVFWLVPFVWHHLLSAMFIRLYLQSNSR